jgi:CRISPR-associated protein Cmr3
LRGEPLAENHLVGLDTLWKDDHRLGIAMDPCSRTAEEGRIYTTETVALKKEVGFLAGVDGAAGCLPKGGLLRFGGDGRGAVVSHCRPDFPETPWQRIADEKRFRVVLLSPGLFPDGWRLPGLRDENGTYVWRGDTFTARLVAASVNRVEVVSGWDLARHAPKPAMRVAPSGSVYWLDGLEGEVAGLQRLVQNGLWPLLEKPDLARRSEGFNNILIAAWPRN